MSQGDATPTEGDEATRASSHRRAEAHSVRWQRTGVPRLDEILGGGLPRGSLVLIMGLPGSGKTTLASQIGVVAAAAGKTTLVLTALSESTDRLIGHLRSFRFFDPELIGGPVQFLSLQSVLSKGLEATAAMIISEARRIKADMVVLDGFRGMRSVDVEPQAAREFLYNVGTTLGALGTTTLITSETDPRDPTFFPESTTADVIIGLHYALLGVRQTRGIEVLKARGAAPLPGPHALTLGADGASVYPQLEERVAVGMLGAEAQTQGAAPSTGPVARGEGGVGEGGAGAPAWDEGAPPLHRIRFDVPELDEMLAGGIPVGTCTLMAGSLGTGKTLLAMRFAVAGVQSGERAVFLGFRESLDQLRQAAALFTIGPELERALGAGGGLTVLEVPPIKVNADVLADRLLSELDRVGAQRLVIDSIAELERAILRSGDPQRLEDYLAALLQALRARHVTALLLKETDKALASTLDFSADPLSVLAENVLLLQQVAYQGQLHRILSVLKLRFSDHDTALREFRIAAPRGFEMLDPFASAPGVLEGIAREQDAQAAALRREGAHRGRRPAQRRSTANDA